MKRKFINKFQEGGEIESYDDTGSPKKTPAIDDFSNETHKELTNELDGITKEEEELYFKLGLNTLSEEQGLNVAETDEEIEENFTLIYDVFNESSNEDISKEKFVELLILKGKQKYEEENMEMKRFGGLLKKLKHLKSFKR